MTSYQKLNPIIMKKFVFAFCLFLAVLLFASWDTTGTSQGCDFPVFKSSAFVSEQITDDQQEKPVYTCSMHPEVLRDKPGKCPECGMNLVIRETKKEMYTCPMHSEVVQDKSGKCPKCGMTLVMKETGKDQYTCPMHPEVTQDKSGKCPKCGMNLVQKTMDKKSAPVKK